MKIKIISKDYTPNKDIHLVLALYTNNEEIIRHDTIIYKKDYFESLSNQELKADLKSRFGKKPAGPDIDTIINEGIF